MQMARKFARLQIAIWDDPEFISLIPSTQIVYLSLISSRDLSWCGVAPLLPKRLTGNSKGLNERKVVTALDQLDASRFVILDHDTSEIAVRTFIHHDQVMQQPNVAKAMGRALNLVHSQSLRASIEDELARELATEPNYAGWEALRKAYPDLYAKVSENPSRNPSGNPFANPSRKAS